MKTPSIGPSESPSWRKSSYCAGGECAELAKEGSGIVVMRNSTRPSEVVRLSREEWRALRLGIASGEFDDLG
jgi:Domain of unknown function (DUF397)